MLAPFRSSQEFSVRAQQLPRVSTLLGHRQMPATMWSCSTMSSWRLLGNSRLEKALRTSERSQEISSHFNSPKPKRHSSVRSSVVVTRSHRISGAEMRPPNPRCIVRVAARRHFSEDITSSESDSSGVRELSRTTHTSETEALGGGVDCPVP